MTGKKIAELTIEVVGNGFEIKLTTSRDGLLGRLGFEKSGDYVATTGEEVAMLCADLVRSCVNGGPITFRNGAEHPLMERTQ